MTPKSPTVRVLFFSLLRDAVGADELSWEIPTNGATVADVWRALAEKFPALAPWDDRLLIAVDLEYAARDIWLKPGQEIAFMPPVQGG